MDTGASIDVERCDEAASMLPLTRIFQSSSASARAALPFRLRHDNRSVRCFVDGAALNVKIFSAQNCPLCDGLKEKLEALRQRSQFQEDIWTGMQIEVCSSYRQFLFAQFILTTAASLANACLIPRLFRL